MKSKKEATRLDKRRYDCKEILDSIKIAMFLTNKSFNITFANKAFLELIGKKSENVIGKKCYQIMHGRNKPDPEDACVKAIKIKKAQKAEYYNPKLKKYLSVQADLLITAGKVEGEIHIITDITDKKRVMEQLEESEEKYKALSEASPDCIKLFDLNGKIKYMNRGGLKEHRLKDLKQILGKGVEHTLLEEDRPKFKKVIEDAKKGKTSTIELRHTPEGSTSACCLETFAPVRDSQGKITAIYGISKEITERKKAEEELMLFKKGVSGLPNPILLADYKNNQPRIIYVNKAFTDFYGYTEKEALGENPRILQSGKQDKEYYKKMWSAILNPKIGFWWDEIVNKKKDKSNVDVILYVATVFNEEGKPIQFIGNHVNITERRKMEETLKKAYAELKEKQASLERFTKFSVGRELKMMELKKQIRMQETKEKK